MKLSDVYLYFEGNWSNVSRALGMTRANVALWVKKGFIPFKSQIKIQEATSGELIAAIEDDFNARVKSKALDKKSERILKDAESRVR